MRPVYEPLRGPPAQEIRLLHLLPGSGPIRCLLKQVRLLDGIEYEALSYCWGSWKSQRQIICNEQDFPVTENLHAALLRLRLSDDTRILWVDAISINQSDISERNGQVAIMRCIFQSATRAIAWLGEEDKTTASGMAFARRLAEISKRQHAHGECPDISLPMSLKNVFRADIPNFYHPIWRHFSRIFERPYFNRMWVVQEIAVCREAVVLCGGHAIDWDALSYANLAVKIRFAAPLTLHIQRTRTRLEQAEDLLRLVVRHSSRHASDPRDMLYALCGLVDDEHRHNFSPNYYIDVKVAYIEFTITCLIDSSTLDIVCIPRAEDDADADFPSWAYPWMPDPNHFRASSLAWRYLEHPCERNFRAAGQSAYALLLSDDKRLLGICGYEFDTVETVGLPSHGTEDRFHSFNLVWSNTIEQVLCYCSWHSLSRASDARELYAPTGEKARDVFWLTCDAGVHNGEYDERKEQFECFDKHMRIFELLYRSISKAPGLAYIVLLATFVRLAARLAIGKFTVHDFDWLYKINARMNRRMIRTGNGYLGLAPKSVRVGDVVGLFEGSRVPLVIRRTERDGRWRLLGECYIHGIMNGEAWDEESCEKFWLE